MARFPQLDWVAINGRDTPFTKPQHYKRGSTSETDLTGHDNPLPTTDERVRAELELIKATQDKILERLDEPIDTQIAGRNVEELFKITSSEEVMSKGSFVTDHIDASGFKYISVYVAWDTDTDISKNRVVIQNGGNSYYAYVLSLEENTKNFNYKQYALKTEMLITGNVWIKLHNEDVEKRNVNEVRVYGWRD